MRAIYDDLRDDSKILAELPTIADSWCVLEEAQRVAPHRFAGLILIPQVGSSMAYVLRRARKGADSSAPNCIDYGFINTLALSAAALANLPFTTTVPLRDGCVMVPHFGMAHFDDCGPWATAEAGSADGRIWLRHGECTVEVPSVPSEDADGWWGLRRLSFGGGPTLTVWLDDLDPMRDLADPVPPARLTSAEVERWAGLLRDAWAILCDVQPELAEALAVGVTSFVPLQPADGWDTRSASTGDAFGAILCSLPPDAVTLAVALAHEFMHIKLGGLMHLLPMTTGGEEALLYAPWRDDPRPLGGLIQGIYAFIGIAAFWRQYRHRAIGVEKNLADFEYAYAREQADAGLETARYANGVTPAGIALLDGLKDEIDSWADDEVSGDASCFAHLVSESHRAGWRIRHCEPDASEVGALAAAWASGSTGAVRIRQSKVHKDTGMRHWSQARLGLARSCILSQGRLVRSPTEDWAAALTDGDLALFAGEAEAASKLFREQIARDAGAVDAWTGLGLALMAGDASESQRRAGKAILDRPEVIMAAYLEAVANSERPPSPVDLAGWVGTVGTVAT